MNRRVRVLATVLVTGLCTAYVLWRVDLRETLDILADAKLGYLALAVTIMVTTVVPMAWRWQLLLAARGIVDRLRWLLRAYFVSYTAGQILPTAIGGDAARIVESSRRHPGRTADMTAIVLLERGLGGVATLILGAVGFVLALGRYDIGAYLWLEGVFVAGTFVLIFVFFARSARPLLRRMQPLLERFRLERPLRAFYEGVHHYRGHTRLLVGVLAFTTAVQSIRILSIWASAKAVGIDLEPRIYFVMGPLFFLVLLVPFTLNGFAVREAFFVSFLGSAGIAADSAFAAGFLYFLVTVALAIPGGVILLREGLRGSRRPRVEETGV